MNHIIADMDCHDNCCLSTRLIGDKQQLKYNTYIPDIHKANRFHPLHLLLVNCWNVLICYIPVKYIVTTLMDIHTYVRTSHDI